MMLNRGQKGAPVLRKSVEDYVAAGGVVVHDERVLVLRRPLRHEVRLPKGHVEPGEELAEAALRETGEESGYLDLVIQGQLGTQEVAFNYDGKHVTRTEHYFLMCLGPGSLRPEGSPVSPEQSEAQFVPEWMPWDEALENLTFGPEQEWVRRARVFLEEAGGS